MKREQTKNNQQLNKGLHQLIELQALKSPRGIAVSYGNVSLTYEELNSKSNLLAEHLLKAGVQSGTLIGVHLYNSSDLIVSLIGIHKAGCAYVPLDPNFPLKRLEYMIQDSQISCIITHSTFKEKVQGWNTEACKIIYIDEHYDEFNEIESNEVAFNDVFDAESLAYVIYTSGSTGNPKGVMISHRSLTNFLLYMVKKLNLTHSDKLLAVTTYCFDISGLELFIPLLVGARCLLCDSETAKDADKLKDAIAQLKPTIMQATPSTWNMLFQVGWENNENLRILCGGELLTESLKQKFLRTTKEVWNLYGPTETTIWSTIKRVNKLSSPANIGKPIANTEVFILDDNLNHVEVGEIGEICIGGIGLAKGYYNQPKLTEDKFIFSSWGKVYRTGDLGRILNNGEIEFLGRKDQQVKIRGYRIELSEIENWLDKYPRIKESVVVVKEQQEHKQLVAYITTYDQQECNSKELKEYLQENLPSYMVPAFFLRLEKLPLTPNLKVDRKLLTELKLDLNIKNNKNIKRSDFEDRLLKIWKKVLGVDFDDVRVSFFDIGGNSVLATNLMEEINKEFGLRCPVTVVFKYNTINEICDYILTETHEPFAEKVEIKKEHHDLPDLNMNDIAIIGMAGKFPMAEDLENFWENIIHGKNCTSEIPLDRWDWQDIYGDSKKETNRTKVKWGGFISGIKEFDSLFFDISPHEATLMDPQQRLLLSYTWLAFENAGIIPEEFAKSPTGVFIAASPNFCYESLLGNEPDKNPYLITGTTLSMIPNRISHFFNFRGPSEISEATCSSSFVALHRAIHSIQMGECEQAIVGAINLLISPKKSIAYDSMGTLCHGMNISSFQSNAQGYLRSEGLAVCVIKPLIKAIKDNDIIFSVIKGSSASHGGRGVSLTAPNQSGIESAMTQAYKRARVDSSTVSYIEAHGTASPIGDSIEIEALKSGYQSALHNPQAILTSSCYLSSLKPCIGHSEVASGMASLFKVVMAINHKVIPGLPNFQSISEKIQFSDSPFKISQNNQQWQTQYDEDGKALPRRASINSYGFGVNAHVVIEEYLQEKFSKQDNINSTKLSPEIIILSAKTQDRLHVLINNLLSFIEKNFSVSLSDIAYTLQVGRVHMNTRFACVISTRDELKKSLTDILNKSETTQQTNIYLTADTKHYGVNIDSHELIEYALQTRDLYYLAKTWVAGADIKWQKLSSGRSPNRVVLPGYPFYKHQHWAVDDKNISNPGIHFQEKIKSNSNNRKRICIIGAGPAGLVMAKSLLEEGHDPVIYEQQDKLGGIWNLKKDKTSGVYKKTRFQNSKDTSFFSDFYPQNSQNLFLTEREVREYLEQYSENFGLVDLINFNSKVLSVEKNGEENWVVEVLQSKQSIREYFDGIALCHGRYSIPSIPDIVGLENFQGEILHSGQYYDNEIFKNKKVLIIGNGVSGMDIAEDAVETAHEVIWCMRSLKLVLPRMVGFLPNDFISPANLLVSGNNSGVISRLKDSMPEYYALYQKSGLFPSKEDFEEYPFIHINDNVVSLVATGKIKAIIGEASHILNDGCVIRGTEEVLKDIDIIVFSTGYDNNKNFNYIKNISMRDDFSMGLFYNKDPSLVNSYGLNDVGTTGTFPYLEMVARWYTQIISGHYQLNEEEIKHRINTKDIIVAPLANVVMGLKLGLLPDPKTSFREFWKWMKYPSFTMVYRLRGPHSKPEVQKTLEKCIKRSLIPDEEDDLQLRICKYRVLAGLGKTNIDKLYENEEITKEEYEQAIFHADEPLILNWDSQYIKRKSEYTTPDLKQDEIIEEFYQKNEAQAVFDQRKFHKKLTEIIAQTLKINSGDISEEDSLNNYGVSSVTLTLLATKISDAYPTIELLPTTFIEHPTLGDLSNYLFNKYCSSLPSLCAEDQPKIGCTINLNTYENRSSSVVEKNQPRDIYYADNEDIAIIGMSGKFPSSHNLLEFWKKLVNGDSFVTKIPTDRWDWQKYYGNPSENNKTDCCYGSFITNIDSFDNELFGISPEEAIFMDPQHRLVLEATWEVMEVAGYSKDDLFGKKIGFFIGIERQDYLNLIKENGYAIDGYFNKGNSHSMLVNNVSHFFGWTGLNTATDAACCSSFVALQQAINSLRIGQSEMAIAGGVHLLLSPDIYISNRKLGLFTNKAFVQPFDKKASGHYFGEGLGLVFLKKLANAYRDKDNILGVIKGISVRHGGRGVFLTAPNIESHQSVIREALAEAKLNEDDIEYIEAQGTGNPLSDTAELKAYHNIFSDKKNGKMMIGTIKGHTGHLAGSSGVISLIKTLMCFKNNYLTKVANFENLNWPSDEEGFSCNILSNDMVWTPGQNHTSSQPRRIGVHNFGFGGVVGHLILEEFIDTAKNTNELKKLQEKKLIVLSASTKDQLNDLVKSLCKYIENKEYYYFGYKEILLADISYTLQIGRQPMEERAIFYVGSISELLSVMIDFLKGDIDKKVVVTGNIKDYKVLQNIFSISDMREIINKWLNDGNFWPIGQLWVNGINVDWHLYYHHHPAKRIILPTYPFKQNKYWIETRKADNSLSLKLQDDRVGDEEVKKEAHNKKANQKILEDYKRLLDENQRLNSVTTYIITLFSDIAEIDFESLDLNESLINLGLDSLKWQLIRDNIISDLNFIISATALIENITIKAIIDKIINYLNLDKQNILGDQQKLIPDLSATYEKFPLTDTQESFMVGKTFGDTEKVEAKIYLEIMENKLDVTRLGKAWNYLFASHLMLRAKVSADGQKIEKYFELGEIETNDLSQLSEVEQHAHLNDIRERLVYKIYDEEDFPLFEICVTKLSLERSIIHFSISELIADAWSLKILLKQWYDLYNDTNVTSSPLAISFRDYVMHLGKLENTQRYTDSLNFWLKKLTNISNGPNLPIVDTSKRGIHNSIKRHRIIKKISKDIWEKLKKKADANRITSSVLLFTVFSNVLKVLLEADNYSIILTSAGRLPIHPEVKLIVGPFLSTFIVEVKSQPGKRFSESLAEYQNEFWHYMDNDIVSGVRVLRELKKRSLIDRKISFPVVFTSLLSNTESSNSIKESPWEMSFINQHSLLLTPQIYFEHQCLEQNGTLFLIFEVAENIYDKPKIEDAIQQYEEILKFIALNDNAFDLTENELLGSYKYVEENISNSVENFKISRVLDDRYTPYSLSDMQNSYLYSRMSNLDDHIRSGQIYYEIEIEDVDIHALERAFQKVINFHDMLRTVICEDGHQQLEKNIPKYKIKKIDLSGMSREKTQEVILNEKCRHSKIEFPLAKWPFFEVTASHLSDKKIILHASFDFLLYDMTSINIIFRDINTALLHPEKDFKDIKLTYRDYLSSLEKHIKHDASQEALNYWGQKFSQISSGPQLLNSPYCNTTSQHEWTRRSLKFKNYDQIEQTEVGFAPLSMVMLTAYAETISEFTGDNPFTIVVVNWDRPQIHDKINDIVGDFTRLSWLEYFPSKDKSFKSKLKEVYGSWLEDMKHSLVPGLKELRKRLRYRDKPTLQFPIVFTNFPQRIDSNATFGRTIGGLSQTYGIYLDLVMEKDGQDLIIHFDSVEAAFPKDFLDKFSTYFYDFISGLFPLKF